jgi:hypothetical protein
MPSATRCRGWLTCALAVLLVLVGAQAFQSPTALLGQRRPALVLRGRVWTSRGPGAAVMKGKGAGELDEGAGEDEGQRRRGRPKKSETAAVRADQTGRVGRRRLAQEERIKKLTTGVSGGLGGADALGGATASAQEAGMAQWLGFKPREDHPERKPREVRSDRAMAQWIAAEKKGRIKVVVAASELEFSLAKSTVLETTAGEEAVREAFALFDDDGSGAIDPSELEQGMRSLGVDSPEDIEQLFSAVDADGSGSIDMAEFRGMLSTQAHVVAHYNDLHTALEDTQPQASPVTAVTIDLTLSGNDLLMDTLAVMQRAVAAHRNSLELIVIKSRAVHDLAMQVFAANRALQHGSGILQQRPLHRPAILCSVGVNEYRDMIPLVVFEGDRVLEIGCHSGTSTQLLHLAAGPRGHVVGVDIGPSIIGKARRNHPQVQFDVAGLSLSLSPPPHPPLLSATHSLCNLSLSLSRLSLSLSITHTRMCRWVGRGQVGGFGCRT